MTGILLCRRAVVRSVSCLLGLVILHPLTTAAKDFRATPFAPRSGDGTAMHFTAIPAGESGLVVENPYDDPSMWGAHYTEFQGGAIGSGICAGDVDGDGRVDIYVVNKTRPNQLFRQVAPFKFVDISTEAGAAGPAANDGVGWKTGATLADVNNDGFLDIYVCRFNAPNLLFVNDGRGTFTEADASRFSVPPFSASVVCAADYDRDGDLDVFIGGRVVPGEYPTTPISMLLENRNGVLVDVTDTVCPALRHCGMVTSALWTDADGDGWLDLLVAGEWMSLRLFNNDKGTFTEVTEAAGLAGQTGWWNSLTAADINNDGAIDYVAGNVGLNTKYHASVERPVRLYYADIEGTGSPQVIEGEYEGDKLFPVRGRSCSSRAMPSLKEKFPTFHDFGGALLDQIYTPEKLQNALKLSATQLASGVFINDGKGHFTFRELPRLAQASPLFGTAAVDFDGDGNVDIIALQNFHGPQVETGRFDGGISLLMLGDGAGNFTAVTPAQSGIAIPGEGRGLALADLNGDGWADLVLTRIDENAMALVNQRRARGHSFAVRLQGAAGNADAVGARIAVRCKDGSVQAGELTAGSGCLSQSQALVFFGYASGNAPRKIYVTWPDGALKSYDFKPGVAQIVIREAK